MNKRSEIGSGLVLIVFAAAFYALSFQIQFTTSDILGSRFFPQAASVLIAVLAAIQIVQGLRGGAAEKAAEQADADRSGAEEAGKEKKDSGTVPLLLTVAALFAYYFLIQQVGFVATSIAYLLFESWILMNKKELGNKKLVAIVVVTDILFPIFLNFIFYNIFHIQLPAGRLFR